MSHAAIEDLAGRVKPRDASNLLLWAIVGFFALFLVWAIFTELDRTVHGAGRVVPTAQLQIVSNLEGGIVKQILVRPGDVVKAGAPIVRLDQTLLGAEYGSSQSATASLQVKIARLEAELAGRTPNFPAATDSALASQIAIESSVYASRQSELIGLTGAASARLSQAERAVAEAEANRAAAITSRDSAKQQADMLRPLVTNGIEPRVSLIQADRQAAVAASQAIAASEAIARARAAVVEARSSLNQIRQDWRAKAAQELAAAQAEVAAKQRTMPALESRVDRTVVRAPLAGRINRVMTSTVGGTIRPGEPIAEIVPAERGLTIETRVKPSDIAFVRMGQRALVKITAYDYSIYGGLEGKVIGISPDSVLEEKTGESYYVVRVRTQGDALTDQNNGQRLPIGPGMIADVNLIGDKRTVMSYLLTPISRLSETAFRER